MHILLIHQAFASLNEPGGTRHHELARFLAERGHRVTVIASPVSYLTGSRGETPHEKHPEPGITILRAYTYPAWHRSFFHRVLSFFSFMVSSLFTALRVRGVDLVWGTSPPIFQAGTAWAVARLKRAPFLLEIRDLWPAFAVGVGVLKNRGFIRAAEAFERFLYRSADRLIINSPGFREHVLSRGARQVELVPNGADTRMFHPEISGESFRQRHTLAGKTVFLYAGAFGLSNDLGVLLRAADLLRDHPEIQLVLLGDGKEKPRLIAQAGEMGLENVHILPPLPKTEMPEALAAADACIAILKPVPEYKTVYPNKVFDYLAAGKPVILAIDGVIREVVESARAGIWVPPGDPERLAQAILELAGKPQERQRMGQHGRAYVVAHFDRQVVALRLEGILRDTAHKS
jgi:glycosyltransferase involved in cell wall biosynthesis